jgi:hypothetical protein
MLEWEREWGFPFRGVGIGVRRRVHPAPGDGAVLVRWTHPAAAGSGTNQPSVKMTGSFCQDLCWFKSTSLILVCPRGAV